jgi:hypothetical protein
MVTPLTMRLTSPDSTLPGPHSMNSRALIQRPR